jgi:predicted Zn-dependent protease
MPEKTLQQIPKVWRDQYEKGLAAFQRDNLDYALSILGQILEKEPGFYECRQALRATQYKKFGEKTSFFKKFVGGASSSPLIAKGQLAMRNNPLEALSIAEQILNNDPNSTLAHKLLADAALAADFPRTAILSLEILTRNSPKDTELARELADAYAKIGDINKAEAIYQDLVRANPNDPELNQAYKNLSAQKTLIHGGYEALASGTGSYRDILKNKEEAVSLEQENRHVKDVNVADRLIAEYQAKLEKEPTNLKLTRSIAELYLQKKEYDNAVVYYQHMIAVSGTADPSIEKAIIDAQVKKYDHLISQLDASAPDYPDQVARLQSERDAFVVEECRKRVERYPSDLQLRFELGQLYFNAGKISEAIQELQKSQANPQRRIQSMSLLGQCYAKRGMNDMAIRALQNALKEKVAFDEEKKELLYTLGCVLEKAGKNDEAIEYLKQVYEVDIGYKDVAAKVDAYYAGK